MGHPSHRKENREGKTPAGVTQLSGPHSSPGGDPELPALTAGPSALPPQLYVGPTLSRACVQGRPYVCSPGSLTIPGEDHSFSVPVTPGRPSPDTPRPAQPPRKGPRRPHCKENGQRVQVALVGISHRPERPLQARLPATQRH